MKARTLVPKQTARAKEGFKDKRFCIRSARAFDREGQRTGDGIERREWVVEKAGLRTRVDGSSKRLCVSHEAIRAHITI